MDDLVPIGRFSRMSRLSIKALRLYDEQGLLRPEWVDPSSGYRYYRLAQANQAEAIRILRIVDMPLDDIRALLSEDDPEFTSKSLAKHRETLEARLVDQERMLRFLGHLIERGGTLMPYEVTVKEIPAQSVASLITHTTFAKIGDSIASGFAAVVGAIGAGAVQPSGAPFIVFHDVIDEQTDGRIEICIPVPPGADGADGDVIWKDVPGGTVAYTRHHGRYDEVGPAYHTVAGWIQDHGHQITGAPREIYLNDPQTVAPEDLLTEVQFPIESS